MSDELPVIWVDDAWAALEIVVWGILPAPANCQTVLEGCVGAPGFAHADWWVDGWLRPVGAWHTKVEGLGLLLRITGNDVELELGFADPHLPAFMAAWTTPR